MSQVRDSIIIILLWEPNQIVETEIIVHNHYRGFSSSFSSQGENCKFMILLRNRKFLMNLFVRGKWSRHHTDGGQKITFSLDIITSYESTNVWPFDFDLLSDLYKLQKRSRGITTSLTKIIASNIVAFCCGCDNPELLWYSLMMWG